VNEPKPNGDAIDAAIAGATQPQVLLRQIKVTIASTGRPALIAIPVDATDSELAELCGWVLTNVMGVMRSERAKRESPASSLVLPPRGLKV
jgi:hypothetical protein